MSRTFRVLLALSLLCIIGAAAYISYLVFFSNPSRSIPPLKGNSVIEAVQPLEPAQTGEFLGRQPPFAFGMPPPCAAARTGRVDEHGVGCGVRREGERVAGFAAHARTDAQALHLALRSGDAPGGEIPSFDRRVGTQLGDLARFHAASGAHVEKMRSFKIRGLAAGSDRRFALR